MVNKGAECFLVYSLFLRIFILRIVIAVTNFMFRKHLYNTYILVYIITSYNPSEFMSKYIQEHPYINVDSRINTTEFRLNHLLTVTAFNFISCVYFRTGIELKTWKKLDNYVTEQTVVQICDHFPSFTDLAFCKQAKVTTYNCDEVIFLSFSYCVMCTHYSVYFVMSYLISTVLSLLYF